MRTSLNAKIFACQKEVNETNAAVESYHACVRNASNAAEIKKGEEYCESIEKEGEIREWNAVNKRCDLSCNIKYRKDGDACVLKQFVSDPEPEPESVAIAAPEPATPPSFLKSLKNIVSPAPKVSVPEEPAVEEPEPEQVATNTPTEEPRPAPRVWWWFLNPFSWFK